MQASEHSFPHDASCGMKFVRRSRFDSIDRLLRSATSWAPTYSELGSTLAGDCPEGYRQDHYQIDLGRGTDRFRLAANGLQSWKAHDVRGIEVFPKNAQILIGVTVIVTLGTPLFALAAPCRIVEVVDEPDRLGFAYGTLPGHPEQGEEAFMVSISADKSVRFDVWAFSRPGDTIVRLSGPIGRGIQRIGTNGYLRALQRFVDQGMYGGIDLGGVTAG
jgi:uncharacterized protein (UPF0548 family)